MESYVYFDDYEKEPIGGDNPYYRCKSCGRSDPSINGILDNHFKHCQYRIKIENNIKNDYVKLLKSGVMWELYPSATGIFHEDLKWWQNEWKSKIKGVADR